MSVELTPADIANSTGVQTVLDSWIKGSPWVKYLFGDAAYYRRQLMDKAAFLNFPVEVVPRLQGAYCLTWVDWAGFRLVPGSIPLHRYRAFKRGKADERADRIRALAGQLDPPISALAGSDVHLSSPAVAVSLPHQPFDVEAHAYYFAGAIAAKLAIADDLTQPLAKLAPEDRAFIDQVLAETLILHVSFLVALSVQLRFPYQI